MRTGLVCHAICRRASGLVALGLVAACGSGLQSGSNTTTSFHGSPPRTTAVFTNGDFENDPIGTMPPSGWTLLNYLNANG
ncbi:MAG TPA: hypothetical protein VG496_19615, partial [Myxococcales bacterium]|nr:hypothetical protein [Myxococcales bacterium]